MAATRDQHVDERLQGKGCTFAYPVLNGQCLFRGAFVAVTAALKAVPAGHADAKAIVGIADARVDNRTGMAGSNRVDAIKGVFSIASLFGTTADKIGSTVYATDDNTATLTGTGGKLKLGEIEAIDEEGVWVRI